MLRFSDGMSLDTSGALRIVHKRDGLYVLGNGWSIPCKDEKEALATLKSMTDKKEENSTPRDGNA